MGPAINSSNPELVSIKEVWVHVLRFFVFLSAISRRLSLVLDHTDRQGGLGGKVGECL